jgi:hypothetical protein
MSVAIRIILALRRDLNAKIALAAGSVRLNIPQLRVALAEWDGLVRIAIKNGIAQVSKLKHQVLVQVQLRHHL